MPVSELKPCPFCFDGGEPKLHQDTSSDYKDHWAWHVWCNGCGAETDYRKDETAAVNLWNQRARPAASPLMPVPGWQSMDSAPKDRLIDIWIKSTDDHGVRWCDCYYDQICDEWRTSRPSGRLMCIKARFVSHWMPSAAAPALPTPPKDGQ